MSEAIQTVNHLINRWQTTRKMLMDTERSEHPNVTDRHGRVWVWVSKDLYRHCGNAVPKFMIDQFGLPTQRALDNPNYDLCSICLNGRTRNVSLCAPAWNCSHAVCQGG